MTNTKPYPPSVPFDFSKHDEFLQDPQLAALYLQDCLEDGDLELFQEALCDVIKAQEKGVQGIAEETNLDRRNLYRALSKNGKPQLDTIFKVLSALNIRITNVPKGRKYR